MNKDVKSKAQRGKNIKNSNRGKTSDCKRQEPRKDSESKRINLDNERVAKFITNNSSNDVKWYAKNPQMLAAAASLPYSNYSGMIMPSLLKGSTFPGVLAFYYDISLGGDDESAVNQAKESMYSFVVHANSRNQSYDSTDLMILTLAGNEVMRALLTLYGCMVS